MFEYIIVFVRINNGHFLKVRCSRINLKNSHYGSRLKIAELTDIFQIFPH